MYDYRLTIFIFKYSLFSIIICNNVQDATQKTLMDFFGDLVSESEMDVLGNFDDTVELDSSR